MKKYDFTSANMGTVSVDVCGEYRDGFEKDFSIIVEGIADSIEIFECDDADDIIQALVDAGVEFESRRSCAFNRMVIQACMITRDSDIDRCIDFIASKDDDAIDSIVQFINF